MRVLKPAWISHDGKPIFSVDIHPDGSRLATGGQGDDYGKIVIWNMAPVRSAAAELDEKVPKVLCQMDNHFACVNCVRWSHNGKFLASGGDDKLIMIWQTSRGAGPSKIFGSTGSVNIVEPWRPVFTLRGHTGDILDLSWSPQDVWLATCSVDNSIIIWNALKFPEQITMLKGHTGLVKGVTWDPVGKYVASQSDDRSLRVWRTMDWKQESVITEPFKDCGGTTHSLRLNWSPDGHHIVSAHAMNNSGPTAQIIERQGFKASLDFVGHRKAITVVRFNPNIFSKKSKMEKSSQYSCCAIGSKDRSLSIWLTALKRPLVVMHELFDNSILDLSWGENGLELMSCSIDGTVAYMDFTMEEIGQPLSKEEVVHLIEKIYGKGVSLEVAASKGSQIIESAALLNLQEEEQNRQNLKNSMLTPRKDSNMSLSMQMSASGDGLPFKPLASEGTKRKSNSSKKEPSKKPKHDVAVVEQAVQSVRQGMSMRKATKYYGIPLSTLGDKIHGRHPIEIVPRTLLTVEEEEKLANWLKQMAGLGFGQTTDDVRAMAKAILELHGGKTKDPDNLPSLAWVYKYFTRRRDLSLRTPMSLGKERALDCHTSKCGQVVKDMADYVNGQNSCLLSDPHRIFNADENGFSFDPHSRKVIACRGAKFVYTVSPKTKKQVTVLACMNAAGFYLDPFFIYPYKNMPRRNIMAGFPEAKLQPRDKQIETRTPDGKRRITPIFLAPQPEIGEVPLPFSSNSNIEFHSSSEKSKIRVEKQNRVTAPGMLSPSSGGSKSMPSPPAAGVTSKDGNPLILSSPSNHTMKAVNETTPEKQVQRSDNFSTPISDKLSPLEKAMDKSQAPVVSSAISTSPATPNPGVVTTPIIPDLAERMKSALATVSSSKERDSSPSVKDKLKSKTAGTSLNLKRKLGDENKKYNKRGRPTKEEQAAREKSMAATAAEAIGEIGRSAALGKTPLSTPAVPPASRLKEQPVFTVPELKLPHLSIEKHSSVLIYGRTGDASCIMLEVENGIDYNVAKVNRLRCTKGSKIAWDQVLISPIAAVCGSKHVACAASTDGTLAIFSIKGRRLSPCLMASDSPPSVFCCSNQQVMLITTKGKLFVWNSQNGKAEIKQQSLADIMSVEDKLASAIITPEGIPVITLANKKSYSFIPDINCWIVTNVGDNKLQVCSNHHRCTPSKQPPMGPLSSLQQPVRPSDQASRAFQSNPGAQQTLTLSHLESQIASSFAIKSSNEYRFWLETYIRYLCQEGLESKLREICDELLGPVHKSSSSSKTWSKFVLGVDKHSVLRNVLPSVGADLRFQRLYTEYKEQLDMVQDD